LLHRRSETLCPSPFLRAFAPRRGTKLQQLRRRPKETLAGAKDIRTVDLVRVSLVELGLLAAAAAVAATALPRCSGGAKRAVVRASWGLTPGVLNSAVMQTTIGATICKRGWTRTVRPPVSYTNALKIRQLVQYRLRGPPSAFQEDHLISLELGGSPTDPRNLWPEPYPRAAAVDRIENELNHRVCAGSLTLAEAQRRESALKHASG
jgi:hypothetical protein